jgi:hypothetical protein
MGYRSNIRCLIYPLDTATGDAPSLIDNYHSLVTLMNTTFKDVVDFWDGCLTLDPHHRVVDFVIDDVKWYPSYPDVAAFEKMLDEVAELGFCYEFVRVGEDNNDIEMRESDHSNGYLGVTTSITCYL